MARGRSGGWRPHRACAHARWLPLPVLFKERLFDGGTQLGLDGLPLGLAFCLDLGSDAGSLRLIGPSAVAGGTFGENGPGQEVGFRLRHLSASCEFAPAPET